MKKLSILVLSFFLFSCSKKDMVTYGTGVGTGLSGYTIFKSFMGQSGTSGNLPVMISVANTINIVGCLSWF